ncbi:MAG: hypothetical protein ACKVYV_15650 [Limisphaerales bacterium]
MPDLIFPTLQPQTTDTERLLLAKNLAMIGGATGTIPPGAVLFPRGRAPRRVPLLPFATRTATAVVTNIDTAGFSAAICELRIAAANPGWSARFGSEIIVQTQGGGDILHWTPVDQATIYRASLGNVAREFTTGASMTPQVTPDGTTRFVKVPLVLPPLMQFFVVPVNASAATYQMDLWLY